MTKEINIDLAWGGYYACIEKDSDEFSIIRLLDFNRDAYHVSLYNETFDNLPSINDVEEISPFVGHVPIDTKELLNYESLTLLGSNLLTRSDLEGYMYYLAEFEVSEDEREELTESLINFSSDKPLKLKLYLSEGELQIEDR